MLNRYTKNTLTLAEHNIMQIRGNCVTIWTEKNTFLWKKKGCFSILVTDG